MQPSEVKLLISPENCSGQSDVSLPETPARRSPASRRDPAFVALNRGLFALVDRADLAAVSRHTWTVKFRPRGSAYAVTFIRGEDGRRHMVQLHRFIWDLHGGLPTPIVDHKNGWGLDCRTRNLREANHRQNAWNAKAFGASCVRGVSWDSRQGRWRARLTVAGRRMELALTTRKREAVRAVRKAARELYGEFARAA